MNFLNTILRLLIRLFTPSGNKQKTTSGSSARPNKAGSSATAASTQTTTTTTTAPPEKKHILPPVDLDETVRSRTLELGNYDEHVDRQTFEKILKENHARTGQVKAPPGKMRHGDLLEWIPIKQLEGKSVTALQTFLINAGLFPPFSKADGIFGYRTLAAVRLFQEYERIYGTHPDWVPDGIVGPATWSAMKEWQDNDRRADRWERGKPSPEYRKWMNVLQSAYRHYQTHQNWILDIVTEKVKELNKGKPESQHVDTLAPEDWTFDENEVHLIGIRRGEEEKGDTRKNDDVFVLLINGLAFKFWGSTDPKAQKRGDEAFLVEGQHKFRFGWHNRSVKNKHKFYQGLNPYNRGVLVFRDDKIKNDNKLTEEDVRKGINTAPNTTINIHWTGEGHGPSGTWSAGCQVIAGHSYVDNDNKVQSCQKHAAYSYSNLQGNSRKNVKMTMGAYDVFCDLILAFSPKPVEHIYYTLGRDDVLLEEGLVDLGGVEMLRDTLGGFNMQDKLQDT